jgi:ABC-type multidrug transport system fused ATPase/permease subunit
MDDMATQRRTFSSLRMIYAELHPYRKYVLLLIVAMLAKTAFDASIPVMLYPVFNQFAGGVLPNSGTGENSYPAAESWNSSIMYIAFTQSLLGIDSRLTTALIWLFCWPFAKADGHRLLFHDVLRAEYV